MSVTGRVYTAVVLAASTMAFARAGAAARQPPRARPATGLSATRLRDATDLLNRYIAEHKIAGAVAGGVG
jgi:hypothetical protein